MTYHSKTLIDNIFTNLVSKETIYGNLTSTMLDHLPQFLIMTSIFSNLPINKCNIFEINWSKFSKEEFILDYFDTDWDNVLNIHLQGNDMNISFNSFLPIGISCWIGITPYKKVSKYNLKLKPKSWITTSLQKVNFI